jgi:flavorubredoxin
MLWVILWRVCCSANLKVPGVKYLDYIISQHAEQDHSGIIEKLVKLYPEAKVLASGKCMDLLVEFSIVPEDRLVEVRDSDKIDPGRDSRVHPRSMGSLA